ncbi:MAG: dihydrodipicolinate synthase family protein [Acidobacteria bacterium]|nr:dihydrodipicolinate synthase family protein [Acidobacteriota bacterium]
MIQLQGILPPLTTPFDTQGYLDLSRLSQNVERYNDQGLAGYVALGSNGEAVHLSPGERIEVIAHIKRAATPQHKIIAGINELSTRAAIHATRAAADVGADIALVVTPYFYKAAMTAEVLSHFFQAVADASPIPIFIYNVPQNTGVVIDAATIAALAAHENIVGLKDSAGGMGALADTLRLVPQAFQVFVGNGGILYPALAMGARGAVLAVACVAPRACVDLYEAVQAGDHAKARDLQNRLSPLAHLVTAGLGVAGLKAALDLVGYPSGLPCPPLLPLNEANKEKVKSVLRTSGLFSAME